MRSRNWKSLLFITLPCILLCTATALAHKDRIQSPVSVTVTDGKSTGRIVSFPPDRKVIFALGASGTVTAITIQLGKSTFRVPAGTCAKISNVRFESVRLLWDGRKESPMTAGAFYIRFSAGRERDRAFGELPEYELSFRGDRFANGRVTKQINRSTTQSFDL